MDFTDARDYKKEIKCLYKSAFPKNERIPLSFLFRRTGNGSACFYAVVDNGEFAGLVYIIDSEKMTYVYFLAVSEEKRGNGYGSKIIQRIKLLYPDRVITLLIEDTTDISADNYQQRINRLKFYQKNGFKQLNIKVNEAGVDFELLGTQTTVTQPEYLALMKNYFGGLLFKFIYRKTILE